MRGSEFVVAVLQCHGGGGVGVGGHVGDAALGGAGDAVLVGGPGEQAAVAAGGAVAAAVPGHLAQVGAAGAGRVEDGAADREHQRVGGGQADLLGRAAVADCAEVAGGDNDGEMVIAAASHRRVHLGRFRAGEEVLTGAGADRDHGRVQRNAGPYELGRRGCEELRAVGLLS